LGCRGTVRILVERLTPGRTPDPVAFLRECLQGRGPGVLATVFRLQGSIGAKVGARLLLHHDGRVTCDVRDAGLAALVEEDARRAVETGRSGPRTYPFPSGAAEVFLEVVGPPTPLVIFGAGHDAAPIVRLAKELGWRVTVVDGRPAYATPGRFPSADEVVVSLPEAIPGRVRLDGDTAALVMTHNYLQDRKLLEILLPSPVRYLGVLGARSRTEQLLADLMGEGMTWPEEQLARLYAPVGLDIGAEGPEGIAIAVLAEIQAVLAGRSGGFLRRRTGSIHLESGQARQEGSWAGAKAACGLSAS
jgi:xanthine/CO dehydrogenase XdhC/CoxF family maturation factor